MRKTIAEIIASVIATSANHAVGTCTYMMRCVSPMNSSGGATKSPKYDPMMNNTTPAAMSVCGCRKLSKSSAAKNSASATNAPKTAINVRAALGNPSETSACRYWSANVTTRPQ